MNRKFEPGVFDVGTRRLLGVYPGSEGSLDYAVRNHEFVELVDVIEISGIDFPIPTRASSLVETPGKQQMAHLEIAHESVAHMLDETPAPIPKFKGLVSSYYLMSWLQPAAAQAYQMLYAHMMEQGTRNLSALRKRLEAVEKAKEKRLDA